MAPMTEGVYDEAIIDVVGPETILSDSAIVKVSALSSIDLYYLCVDICKGYQYCDYNSATTLILLSFHGPRYSSP